MDKPILETLECIVSPASQPVRELESGRILACQDAGT